MEKTTLTKIDPELSQRGRRRAAEDAYNRKVLHMMVHRETPQQAAMRLFVWTLVVVLLGCLMFWIVAITKLGGLFL